MKLTFCAIAALLPAMAAAQPTAEDTGQAVYRAYLYGRHAAVLKLETDCWKGPAARAEAGARECVRTVVAGGLLDLQLQRRDRRGPMPAFAPDAQRERIHAALKAAGHDEAAAERVMGAAAGDVEGLLAGLMQAGLR